MSGRNVRGGKFKRQVISSDIIFWQKEEDAILFFISIKKVSFAWLVKNNSMHKQVGSTRVGMSHEPFPRVYVKKVDLRAAHARLEK